MEKRHLATFDNSQETFDWLEENIENGWYVDDETVELVTICFDNESDARFARESLNGK